jgi:TolB-like protein/tetratricopeptide (TPR) repeat protein
MNENRGDQAPSLRKPDQGAFSRRWILLLAGALVVIIALAIGLNVGGVRERLFGGVGVPRIEAMAILPVENLSKDPEQAYFAQGMTALLINTMGRVKAVRLTGMSSVNPYRKNPKPRPEIARELDVDAVVEAGVLRVDDRLRLTVRLIHAPTDRLLWDQIYERELRDLPSLRNEVCRAIAHRIEAKLTATEEERLRSRPPVNPKAQEALMLGMWGGNPGRTDEYLTQAVQIDPSYAEGYDYMSSSYSMRLMYPTRQAPKDIYPRAREAARNAVRLDPNAPLAHRVLGTVALEYDWDFAEAEKEFKRGLELIPQGPHAQHMYSHYLLATGRVEEARAVTQGALEADPMNSSLFACASWHEVASGNPSEAERLALRALSLGAPDQLARLTLGWSYALRGRHDEAIAEFQKAVVGWKGAVFPTASLGYGYAVAGQEAATREVLDKLLTRSKTEYVSPYEIAVIFAGLGDKDRAFEWLEKAYEERATLLVYFRMDPRIWSLRSDARFQGLLDRMNFPKDRR